MKSLYTLLLGALLTFGGVSQAQNATFTFTTTGTNAQVDSVLNYVGGIWSAHLISSVPIKVNLIYVNLTSLGPLGITFPNGIRDFPGAPFDSTLYPTCLAGAITGTEVKPGEVDMDVYINSHWSWYLGTDGNCPSNQYDLATTLCHEIGHGLGFLSLAKEEAGNTGSFGNLTQADFFPLAPTFPWPDQDGKPSVWDQYLKNLSGQVLIDTNNFANPSAALYSQFTGDKIRFTGPQSVAALNGTQPKVYAPSAFALGSSMTHLDENTFGPSNINRMMTPFGAKGDANHSPGPLTIAILTDLGWSTIPVTREYPRQVPKVSAWPNPFSAGQHGYFKVQSEEVSGNVSLEILDLSGKRVFLATQQVLIGGFASFAWDGRDSNGKYLSAGMYLYRLSDAQHSFSERLMIME